MGFKCVKIDDVGSYVMKQCFNLMYIIRTSEIKNILFLFYFILHIIFILIMLFFFKPIDNVINIHI